MKDNKEYIDLIERYLDEELNQEELEMFSNKLNSDPEFSELFYEMDRFVEGIRLSASKTSMEEKLARLEQSLPVKKNRNNVAETPVHRLWDVVRDYKYGIAATLSLLIIATFVLVNPFSNAHLEPAQLADQYFSPFDNAGSGVKRGEKDRELLQQALLAYDRADYKSAIEIFRNISITEENMISVWMYGGNAYLATGDTGKAEEMFRNIIRTNIGFGIQAKWYLSLCYLKEGDVAQAIPLLKEIESTGKYNHEKAGEILARLEK